MQEHGSITLAFEAEVTVHQTIRLLYPMSEDDVVSGLRACRIITTLWHNQGESGASKRQCELLDLSRPAEQQLIGFIESQQVDGDYRDYR